MKRYIRLTTEVDIDTSMFAGTPFKCDTDTSYYNDFLNTKELAYMQSAKNRTGKVVMMSPNEYFQECADKVFSGNSTVAELKASREYDAELNAEYMEAMQSGAKFPLCYINYAAQGQEGLHRMMIAGDLYGWDTKFPVLVVDVYDQAEEDARQLNREISDFRRHYFDHICEHAADNLADWKGLPPDNYAELLHDEIVSVAEYYDQDKVFDIDVDIKLDMIDDEPRALVYLTRYFDHDITGYAEPEELWLTHYFNLSGEDRDSEIKPMPDNADDIDLDDLDLSDDSLLKLFYRD